MSLLRFLAWMFDVHLNISYFYKYQTASKLLAVSDAIIA